MWIEAIVSVEDLRQALSELAPLKLRLGDGGGELALEAPSEVTLVAEQGARIVCAAQLHWPVLGVNVPVTMTSLTILLRPVIERHDEIDALVFKLELEHADLALVPEIIDDRITKLVNDELAKKHVELSWTYAETLDHVFHLPAMLEPAEALALTVTSAIVKVTTEAVGLAICLRSDIRRGEAAVPRDVDRESAPAPAPRPLPPPAPPLLTPAGLAVRGAIAGLALGAVFALGRASRRRAAWSRG